MIFLDPGQQPSDKGPRQLPTDELASLGTQQHELPSAEDLLGPKPQAAKGETDELPSLEDLLGPRPSEPVKSLTGRVADFFFTDPRSALTHIGDAFGQTLNTDLSDENLDIPKETREWLRKKGVWGDFASGHVSLQQAMIESYMRQGAMRVNHAIMAVPALVHAASAAVAQAGEETRGTGLERTFQAIGLGSPQQLTREVAAIPEAFPTFDFHNGIATTEQLRAHPVWKQIEEARDLKVIGKDGEAGWKGLHVAEPRTAAETAREAAPLETPPAEAEAAAPAPSAPAFDIHAEARRIDPGTISEYDALAKRQQILRGWVERHDIVMRPDNLANALRETEKRMLELAPKVNAAYAEAGKGLPNAGRTVETPHPGTPTAPAAEAEAAPAGPQGEAAVPAEGATPARLAGAEGAQAGRTIDRTHDVPYLAGSSNDGTTTYIDKRVPAELTVKGVTFDPAKYLSVHEATEHALMVDRGEPYETAHREALKAEQAAVEADGIDWKTYQEEMTKLVGTTEHEKAKTPPPDLYTKPYPHAEAEFLKREGEATPAAIPSSAAGVAAPETAANVSRETPGKKIPSLDQQRDYIIADMREQLRKVRKAEPGESEQTRQARIDAEAQLYASQMITLAGLFEGKLGTAEDLYRAEGIEIQKAGAIGKKVQRAGPGAVRTVAMAGERLAEGKKIAAERRAQGLGTGGTVTTEAQRYATMAKEDKEALKAAYEDEREALEPEEREGVPEAAGLMSDDDWEFMAEREAAGLPLFQRVNPETRDLVTQAKQAEADLRRALEGVEVGGSEVQPMDLALNKGLINRLPPAAKAAAERHAELSAAIDAKLEALDAQITKALQGVEVDGDPVDLMDIAVNRRLRESVPAEVQALMDERDVLTSNEDEAKQRELFQQVFGHQTDTLEFKAWFGDSKVVDAAGEPQVMYHGTKGEIGPAFLPERRGAHTKSGGSDHAFFFTSKPTVAETYAEKAPRHEFIAEADRLLAQSNELREEKAHLLENAKESDWKGGEFSEKLDDLEYRAQDYAYASDELRHHYATQPAQHTHNAEYLMTRLVGPERARELANVGGEAIVPAYLSVKNPVIVEAGGKVWHELAEPMSETIAKAKAAGHDGVIFRDVYDALRSYMGDKGRSDIVAAFEPTQIKSAIGNRGTFSPEDARILYQIQAYHGSPHHFERFDISKIGIGEGAQAYGHGLYFAENEGVARGYKERLAPGRINQDLKFVVLDRDGKEVGRYFDENLAASEATKLGGSYDFEPVNEGALYRVTLKPDKEDLLDWDKPLNEQPVKVQEGVKKAIEAAYPARSKNDLEKALDQATHASGESLVRRGLIAFNDDRVSKLLLEAGIPGIKYADAGSRTDPARIKTQLDQVREAIATVEKQTDSNTKAERLGNLRRDEERLARDYKAAVNPTHNFVIFNDKDIEITHRNGEPLTKEERTEAVDELEQRREAAIATKELEQRGLEQTARRGSYAPALEGERPLTRLGRAQNASTVIHEFGHDFLEKLARYAEHPLAPDQLKSDWEETKKYLEIGSGRDIREIDEKGELTKKARFAHERFATAYEQWLMLGVAPSRALVRVFTQFRNWLLKVYDSYEALVKATPHGREVVRPLTPEMIQVFRRMHDINPDDTIIAPSPRMQRGLGDIHEARAEAAEALPSQAGRGVAREIQGERDSHAAANVVEEEHARLTNVEARTGERAPGTPQPPGHPDETGTQRGEAGGAAAPGEVVPGGGEAAAQRAGEGASRAGASLDKGSGVKTEPPPNANVSFGPNSKHTDAAGNFRTDGLTDVNKIFDALRENAAKQGGIVQKRRAGIPLTDGDRLNLGLTAGLDPSWLDAKQIGDAYSEREVEALQRLIVQISTEIKDLSAAAATGDEAAVLAKAEKNSLLELVQAHLSGATAEWGRTGGAIRRVVKKAWGNLPQKTVAEATASLAAVRRMKGQKWESPEQLSLALKQETGRTLFQTQEVAEYTSRLTNPAQVARLIADTSNGRMTQAVQFYYVNALLSGPITHFRYAIGNGVTALYAPAKTTVAATFDWAMYQAGIREQQMVFHGEAWEELWALTYGSRKALQAGKEGWRLGNTPDLPGEVHPDIFGAQPIMPPIPGIWGQIIGTPGKAVGFIHGFGSQLRYEQGIAKLAYRNAMLEKLEGDAFKNRMAELQNRPTPEMMEQAAMVARKDLYMAPAEYGSFLANLSRISDTNIITKVLLPFVKIGMNIDKIAVVEGTPAGLFAKKVRANLLGRNGQVAQAEQSANLIAGMGMMGMATLMVAEGMATGDGPNDPNLRREWLKTNEPNSIKVGPFWLSYKGLGAIGMQMRLAANSYEAGHGWGEDEHYSTALALLEGFEKAVLGESFMTGLKDMIEAVYHAEEHGERYIANMVTNWLPFSVGMGQMTKLFDPYERETHARTTLEQIGKATLEHIPFASRMLYPRRDSFGEPISAHGLNPSYANDPLVRAMSELHVPVAPIKHTIRGVQLTDAQYDEYAMKAGRKARENMNITLRTAGRGYRTFAPEERVRLINLFKKDHEEAVKEFEDYVMQKSIVHGHGLNKYGDTNDIMKQAIENTKVKKGIEARPVPH